MATTIIYANDSRYWCTYPNGKLTLVPAILSILISTFSIFAWATCSFAKVDIQSQMKDAAADDFLADIFSDVWDNEIITSYKIGLYQHEILNPGDLFAGMCVAYIGQERVVQDFFFRTAQVLGITSGVIAFIMMATVWTIAPRVRVSRIAWKVIGLIFIMVGIIQILTIPGVHLSNVCKVCAGMDILECTSKCQISTGGALAIVTTVMCLVSGIVCCFIPNPKDDESNPLPIYSPNAMSATPMPHPKEENSRNNGNQHHKNNKRSQSHQHSHRHSHQHAHSGSCNHHHNHNAMNASSSSISL